VEEAAFLMAMQRIIGGIQIENDVSRRPMASASATIFL